MPRVKTPTSSSSASLPTSTTSLRKCDSPTGSTQVKASDLYRESSAARFRNTNSTPTGSCSTKRMSTSGSTTRQSPCEMQHYVAAAASLGSPISCKNSHTLSLNATEPTFCCSLKGVTKNQFRSSGQRRGGRRTGPSGDGQKSASMANLCDCRESDTST